MHNLDNMEWPSQQITITKCVINLDKLPLRKKFKILKILFSCDCNYIVCISVVVLQY